MRWGLSLAVLVAVGALAVQQGPRVAATLAGIDAVWAALGLGAFWCGHVLRSVRLRHIAGDRLPLWPAAVSINAAHAVTAYFLPLQSGDLALPGILRWVHGRKLAEGVDILVRLRLLDVSALGIWICAAMALVPDTRVPIALRAVGSVIGLALALCPWILKRISRLAHTAPRGIDELGLSLAIWGLSGASVWAAAHAVGLALGFGEVWLLLALQLPLQFLPVQGVANTGSHELSWVSGLALLGVPAGEALGFALASHALILCYVASLVPLGAAVWLDRPAPAQRGGSAGSS